MPTSMTAKINEQTLMISVIMPTYNRSRLIPRAIKSVLDQDFTKFELIVVSDGSTDQTADVVRSFSDKRIRFIEKAENHGAPTARNTAIKASQGRYIAFLDDDDEWLPQKLDKQVKVFEKVSTNTGVVYTAYWYERNGKKNLMPNGVKKPSGNIHDQLLSGNFVTTSAAMVRREGFDQVGLFDEDMPRLQDWELFIRMSRTYFFEYIDEPMLVLHRQKNSISTDKTALINALEKIVSKHHNNFKNKPFVLVKNYLIIGVLLSISGKIRKGLNFYCKAILASFRTQK